MGRLDGDIDNGHGVVLGCRSTAGGITANEVLLVRTEEIIEVMDRDRDQIKIEILRSKQEVSQALGQNKDGDQQPIIKADREAERLTEETLQDEVEVIH